MTCLSLMVQICHAYTLYSSSSSPYVWTFNYALNDVLHALINQSSSQDMIADSGNILQSLGSSESSRPEIWKTVKCRQRNSPSYSLAEHSPGDSTKRFLFNLGMRLPDDGMLLSIVASCSRSLAESRKIVQIKKVLHMLRRLRMSGCDLNPAEIGKPK
jgi:hypothetical protein